MLLEAGANPTMPQLKTSLTPLQIVYSLSGEQPSSMREVVALLQEAEAGWPAEASHASSSGAS
jgi:hypothetical protein